MVEGGLGTIEVGDGTTIRVMKGVSPFVTVERLKSLYRLEEEESGKDKCQGLPRGVLGRVRDPTGRRMSPGPRRGLVCRWKNGPLV